MSVGGKGRGRGALKAGRMPGMLEKSSRESGDGQERSSQLGPLPSELFEARVTEILDCSAFWAQIGTAASLEQFDHHCAALNDWCLENKAVLKSLPKVNDIVAVLEKESGTWVRAKVTRQLSDSHIELFYIDSGTSGRVLLDSICATSSPLLYQCPAQALQCSLRGVQLLDMEDSWSEEAVSRFTELLKGAAKIRAWNHPTVGSYSDAGTTCCSVTLYIMHEERWTSVGEILAREKLAKYASPGPIYLHTAPSVPQRLVRHRDDSSSVPTEPTSEEDSSSSTVAELQELEDKRLSDLGVDTPPTQEPSATRGSLKSPKTPPLDELDPTPVPSEEGVGGGGGEREGNGEGEGGTDVRKAAEEEPVLREKAVVEKQDQGRKMQLSELNELTNAANFDTAVATMTESSEVATTKPAAETAAAVGTKVAMSGPEEKTKPGQDPPLLNDSDSQSDDSWDWSIFPSRANGPSGSSEASLDSPYKVDPLMSNEQDVDRRRKAQMKAQYDAIMAEGDKAAVSGRFHHGRKKQYNRRHGGQDHAPYQQGPMDHHGGAESEGGERGEWSKWAGGGPQGRRFRLTGGAGRGHSRSDMPQEGVPGAMRGVRVNRLPRDQQFSGERGGRGFGGGRGTRLPPRFRKQQINPPPAYPAHPPADPTHFPADSTHPPPLSDDQPVELFNSKPQVITGMTQGETQNEVDWHVWKVKQKMKKLLETLSSSTAPSLGSEVKKLLEDSSGQKLATLPSSKGPLWYILESMVFGAIGKPSEYIDAVVMGIASIHSVASQDVCRLLQPVLEGLARDTCEGSAAADAQKNRHTFCSLVGKLLIKTSYSDKEEFSTAVGRVVRHFLNTWSECAPDQKELQSIAFADCFAALSEEIGPTIDITNKSTLDAYFDGAIKEHILAAKLPRSVRERLLEASLRRAGGWGGATNQPHPQLHPKSQAGVVLTATESEPPQQQQGPQPAFQSVGALQQYSVQQPPVAPSSPPSCQPSAQVYQRLLYSHQSLYQPASSSQAAQFPSQPLQSPAIAPTLQHPFQSPTVTPALQHSSQSLRSPTFTPALQHPSQSLQSPTFTPALQQPPHPLLSPTVTPALQHSSQSLQSPTFTPALQHPPHPLQSPTIMPAPQHPSHPLQSPTFTPAIQQYSPHPLQSPTFTPALQHPSHPLQHPPPAPTPQPAMISHFLPLSSPPVPVAAVPQPLDHPGNNPYSRVEEMLSALGLLDLLEMCKQAMIKDSVLDCKRDELKMGLKEAGLPVGAIIAIADYLEKSRHQRTSSSSTHSLPPPALAPTPVPLSPVEHQPSQMTAAPGPPTQGFPSPQTNAGQYGIGFMSQQVPPQTAPSYSAPQYQYTSDAPKFEVGQTHTYLRPTWTSPVQKDIAPPITAVAMGTSGGNPPVAGRAGGSYGFGGFRCVVCGSQKHKSEDCSERSTRFFI